MVNSFPVLGFDIGGTKIAVALVLSSGKIISSTRIPNRDRCPEDVLPDMVSAGRSLLTDAGLSGKDLSAIGVCSPSPLDFEKGLILSPSNLKQWTHVPVRDYLCEAFGKRTFFDNDANAAALAEWLFGSGVGVRDMLYVAISTGIGAGVIMNGSLMRGVTCDGGEVGHMILDKNGPLCNCGLHGCWEAYCGGRSVAQRMQKELTAFPDSMVVHFAGDIDQVDMKALAEAVKERDPYACGVWAEMMERNAQAIGMLHNIFNPALISLGTIAIQCGDLFLQPLRDVVKKYCWKRTLDACTIVPGKLGSRLGEFSGAAVALYALYACGEWTPPHNTNSGSSIENHE